MIRALTAGFVALVATVALGTPAAVAESASAGEVRRLAAEAAHDPVALERLREIDDVDGRPVDLGAALRGDGRVVSARLRALAGGSSAASPGEARADARRILAGGDFRQHHPPRPLRGPLRWLGDRVRPIGEPLGRFFGDLDLRGWLATGLAALVVLAATVGGMVVVRRRNLAVLGEGGARVGRGGRESPESLERQAERASRDGDHESALRLRFRAGLLRLDAAGALRYRPSLTTGAVTRQVRSATLADLATAVDEVVYGGREASAEDVEEARRGWPAVLVEAKAP